MKRCKYCGGIIEINEKEIKELKINLRKELKTVTTQSLKLGLCKDCFRKIGLAYFHTYWYGEEQK